MTNAQLNAFREIAEQMIGKADWEWISRHMSQRMFGPSPPFVRDWWMVVIGSLCIVAAVSLASFGWYSFIVGRYWLFGLAMLAVVGLTIGGLHLCFLLSMMLTRIPTIQRCAGSVLGHPRKRRDRLHRLYRYPVWHSICL
jgi:hypothetical protein